MRCDFNWNENDQNKEAEIRIGEPILETNESFRYLGSVIHKFGRKEDDVTHCIQACWLKWRVVTKIMCDKNVPLKLKGKFYRVTIRPAVLYGHDPGWSFSKKSPSYGYRQQDERKMIEIVWPCQEETTISTCYEGGVYYRRWREKNE
ncbi:hypothetical protein Tco_0595586 [Tanacetum coccineum]